MPTVKQLEAFYWTARLGTLARAADRLHVTQSAITKRLRELEAISAAPLFEPGPRKAVLTLHGREMLGEVERLLALLGEL